MTVEANLFADMGIDMIGIAPYDVRDFVDPQPQSVQATEPYFNMVQPVILKLLDKRRVVQREQKSYVTQDVQYAESGKKKSLHSSV